MKHYIPQPQYLYHQERGDDDEIDLAQLWQVLVRQKTIIITAALSIFFIALLIAVLTTPIYKASTTIQIQPNKTQLLEYGLNANGENIARGKDFYQTQYEILKSHNIANRVIAKLDIGSKLANTS